MTITPWSGDLSGIDNTFGYNDYLITATGNASLPTGVVDDLTADAMRSRLSGRANASSSGTATLSHADAEALARPGDQLFSLPNGGILLRRSVFSDACPAGSSRPNNSLLMSHEMSRALAFFGDSYQGADASGAQWCRRAAPGTNGTIETPWDVSTLSGLRNIEAVLDRIKEVRAGRMPSDIQPAQQALARELARAIPDTEMTSFAADIRSRRGLVESAGDMFMRHPVLHTLGIAVLFGLGTDAYHVARYLLAGGESPFKGPFSIFGGIRSLIQGIRDFFNRRPPNDPGSGSSGGGGTNPPPPSNNPPQNAAQMSALPDVAAGILAFGGANPGSIDGTVGVPSVGAPTLNPGVLPVPALPVPGAGPVVVIEPVPVAVPRFVPVMP